MNKPCILHMLTPARAVSPFDATLALDAGFDVVLPYAWVELSDVPSLIHDVIFARPPEEAACSGVFIGGEHAGLALDMLDAAKEAIVAPFGVSLFADPAGSFTAGAAMVALTERILKEKFDRPLAGLRVAIFGGTGAVAFAAAALAAGEGASVTLVGHDGLERVDVSAGWIADRFGLTIKTADGARDQKKNAILAEADVLFCAGPAGQRVIDSGHLAGAGRLLVAIDSNAVPPLGIEGLESSARAAPFGAGQALGMGALAVGELKYAVQSDLFKAMRSAREPVILGFRDAFALARRKVKED